MSNFHLSQRCHTGVAVSINSLILVYSLNQLLYKTSKTHYPQIYILYTYSYIYSLISSLKTISSSMSLKKKNPLLILNLLQMQCNAFQITQNTREKLPAGQLGMKEKCFLINVVLEIIILIILRLTRYSIYYFISTQKVLSILTNSKKVPRSQILA